MKHLIQFQSPRQDDATYWTGVHASGYEESIFSVTQDRSVREKLLDVVGREPAKDVLIPGCGTHTYLQEAIVERSAGTLQSLVCTDFATVVSQIVRESLPAWVKFEGTPTQELACHEMFDAAIVVNSIVSPDDVLNRVMIGRIAASLKARGRLIGLFPTIFTDVDLISLGHDNQPVIDIRRNLIFETQQAAWQLAYSPLRLRLILREAGLEVVEMQIVFLESLEFMDQARLHYGITDPDLPIWELLVEARKV